MTAAPVPLEGVVLAKVAAHWLTTGLPLALAAPLFGLLVALDGTAMGAIALTLLAGTPALSFVSAVGAALTAPVGTLTGVKTAPVRQAGSLSMAIERRQRPARLQHPASLALIKRVINQNFF